MLLTNEEKRVQAYSSNKSPTISSKITPKTKLSDLNLNWTERQLPEKERTKHVHRLHPYLGKYIPQLVEIFLRKYFKPGQTVLDPFCGSGTTLVQARELGINSIGYDVSAFNILLCEAKTQKYDIKKVRREVLDIIEKVRHKFDLTSNQTELWEKDINVPNVSVVDITYLEKWFAPLALAQLTYYLDLINTGGYQYHKLLKIILCRSARSARLTTHFDLDFPKKPQIKPYWCYKHSRECLPTSEALKFLARYSIDTLERIEQFSTIRTDALVKVRHSDSRKSQFPPHNGVITSPPYVGLIDYHEQHAYAYALLGLHDKRENEIGSATNGSSEKARMQYQQDISKVLNNCAKSMRDGGKIIVVANDRSQLYEEIIKNAKLIILDVVHRHVNRRTGRRSNDFYESIFITRKNGE